LWRMGMKVGDTVTRNMFGCIMDLVVTEVTDDRIICDTWEFDRATGLEIDDMLSGSPSYIQIAENKEANVRKLCTAFQDIVDNSGKERR